MQMPDAHFYMVYVPRGSMVILFLFRIYQDVRPFKLHVY